MGLRIDIASGRVETARSGALLGLLGFLLAAASAWLLWMLFTGGHGIRSGERPAGPQDSWLPALTMLGGLALAGYRSRTEIDAGTRTRTRWSRWWWNERTVVDPLGEPRRVQLETQRRGSGKNSRIVHPLTLVTSGGAHELASPGSERVAREQGEALARLFQVSLHDLRGGTPLVRGPDELDRSVVDSDGADEFAPRPPGDRVRIRHDGARTELVVRPPYGWLVLLALGPALLPGILVLAFWLPGLLDSGGAPHGVAGRLLLLAVPAVFAALPLGVLLAGARNGGLLTRRLLVERGELRAGRLAFPWSEIEELHVSEGSALRRGLRIGSDRATLHVGRGLSLAELRFLRSALLQALRERR